MGTLTIFRNFFRSSKASGMLLLGAVVIAMILANTNARTWFSSFLGTDISLHIGSVVDLPLTISTFVNDVLMAVFFLLVGLEIKRELLEGELSDLKQAALPVVAALGGMLIPAGIYAVINIGTATSSGWGIPMATDIAFALAIIGLLGRKVPPALKIFLAALAIVDDLGAIVVIAIFYTESIHFNYLLWAGGIVAILTLLNLFGVKKLIFYIIPGIFLWYFIHHSGIHATIAGVLLAFTIPTNETRDPSPLEKLEHFLNKPVNFLIMPVFALANTNITLKSGWTQDLSSELSLGIIGGLFLGKTLGVTFFSWLAVRLKWAVLPFGTTWKHIFGTGMLAGIGFTMSIFIALLSFQDIAVQDTAKIAVLVASLVAGMTGFVYLKNVRPNR